jgi:hypothetical protein
MKRHPMDKLTKKVLAYTTLYSGAFAAGMWAGSTPETGGLEIALAMSTPFIGAAGGYINYGVGGYPPSRNWGDTLPALAKHMILPGSIGTTIATALGYGAGVLCR